ncbi:tetraspanin-18-like [Pieris napi]|uniref:tetraspanin-18-like n=1 Tax=Pieris napi TaxID=78633 RepID=UPI001FB9393F|nr:tetraspanin-18-like [Pieris napi]
MGCGEFLVKYILFFANLFFALAGLALIGLGVAVELQIKEITNAVEASNFHIAPIAAIVVGSVVFLIAFFGCCGAVRENNCMLITYSIFMLILMLLKVTLAVLIFVNLDSYVKEIPRWLNEAFSRDQTAFHQIEKTFKCCGPTGPLSYGNLVLPETCCASTPCTPFNSYTGCATLVEDFFQTFGVAIGALAIAVVAIELVAIVFGLCLANHARNQSRRAHY